VADGPDKRLCDLWLGLVLDTWRLSAEATLVVPLRLARLARGGPQASREAQRMVAEKIAANRTLVRQIAAGAHGKRPDKVASGAMKFYLKRVRANRRRLIRDLTG